MLLMFCYSPNPTVIQWTGSRNKLVANIHPRLAAEVNSFPYPEVHQSHLKSLRGERSGNKSLNTSGFCTEGRVFLYFKPLMKLN